jgi:hypothetical protein
MPTLIEDVLRAITQTGMGSKAAVLRVEAYDATLVIVSEDTILRPCASVLTYQERKSQSIGRHSYLWRYPNSTSPDHVP